VNEIGYHGSDGWVYYDVTASAGSSVRAAPNAGISIYSAFDGPRIYYVDANQHVNEIGYHSNGWLNYDVTALAGSSAIAYPNTTVAVYAAYDGPRIYYVDTNQYMNEIGYHGSNGWANFNLAALADSGTHAAPGAGTVIYQAADGPRVYYTDINQHLNEIGYHGSSGWVNFDVTAFAGTGALATAGTAFALVPLDDGPRIAYVDGNEHLQQMAYDGSWYNQDLTMLSVAPPVGVGSTVPTVLLRNLTHPQYWPNFEVGDTFQVTITGRPNQPVSLVQTVSGTTSSQSFGNTDAYGNLVITYVEQISNIGSYTQVWSVGGVQAATAISFVIGQFGDGTLYSTDLAQSSTGQIQGVLSLSIANGNVTTYSATEFDYQTSLYYDAGAFKTLYEDGSVVRSASASGGGTAGGNLSYPASTWADYTIATDHYATAYFVSGGFYYNPYYFQSGTCEDYSSDCTFVSGSGDLYISTALIYLGSTATEHTNVAIDGSDVPLSDNDAYTGFMEKVPPANKDQLDGFKFSVTKLLKDYRLAALLAASAYQHQDQNAHNYQLPMYLKLVHDDVSSAPPVVRIRRYKVLDIYGNSWRSTNPLKIDERFTYVAGSLPLPPTNREGWSIGGLQSNDLRDGPGATLEDTYGVNSLVSAELEIDFWQIYYASNFSAPGATFPISNLPGITPGQFPLILILPSSPFAGVQDGLTSCGDFAIQSIRLTTPSVQFNGDNGPHGVCAYR
jgi:hypothetical protein